VNLVPKIKPVNLFLELASNSVSNEYYVQYWMYENENKGSAYLLHANVTICFRDLFLSDKHHICRIMSSGLS